MASRFLSRDRLAKRQLPITVSFLNYTLGELKKLLFPIRLFLCCFFELDWVSLGTSSVNRMITTKLSVPVLLPSIVLILLLKDTAGKLNISTLLSLIDIMDDKLLLTFGAKFQR